jgi:hypothetical protein
MSVFAFRTKTATFNTDSSHGLIGGNSLVRLVMAKRPTLEWGDFRIIQPRGGGSGMAAVDSKSPRGKIIANSLI